MAGGNTPPPAGSGGSGARVLVIEPQQELWRALRGALVAAGYGPQWAPNCASGLEAIDRWRPDLVLLEPLLPDGDGLDLLRTVRARSGLPVLLLSARDSDHDKIEALDSGADDYLTKPFSMGELLARIRVALRKSATSGGLLPPSPLFTTGDLVLDYERRLVTMRGVEVHLTPTEYAVLKYLASYAGRVVTHPMVLRAVWGADYEQEAHYLRVFVNGLRRKLEPEPSRPTYILTVPGVGYRLRMPSDPTNG